MFQLYKVDHIHFELLIFSVVVDFCRYPCKKISFQQGKKKNPYWCWSSVSSGATSWIKAVTNDKRIPLPFQHTVDRTPCTPPGQRTGSTPILFSCAASWTSRVSGTSLCLSAGSPPLKVPPPADPPWLTLFQLCCDSEVELAERFGSWSPTGSRRPPEPAWHIPVCSSGTVVAKEKKGAN